jgi:hypothetical protein
MSPDDFVDAEGFTGPNSCSDCGEPLDDFGPCMCGVGTASLEDGETPKKRRKRKKAGKNTHAFSMRHMVHRKLEREGKLPSYGLKG